MRIAQPSTELPLRPQVELSGLWHRYRGPASSGDWTLRDIDFQLRPGELVGLLGPSGCGKTTLLRLIAGFERPDRGVVRIGGQEVAGPQRWLPPERRGQDSSRAAWLLELLGLKGLEQRYPHELSGGQRQRLALARALAPGSALVLLDEPFSNLDVEVRLRLRAELPGVLARCGASGVIVTHDPEEALAICDRVAVLEAGRLHQCASPQELVNCPATAFVGRFVLQGNLLSAQWQGHRLRTPLGWLEPEGSAPLDVTNPGEEPLQVLLSPQGLELVPDDSAEAWVVGREFLGREWLYQVQSDGQRLRLRLPLSADYDRGQRCRLQLRAGEPARLFPGGQPLRAAAELPV